MIRAVLVTVRARGEKGGKGKEREEGNAGVHERAQQGSLELC